MIAETLDDEEEGEKKRRRKLLINLEPLTSRSNSYLAGNVTGWYRGNALDLYSGCVRFERPPGYRLS
jgi:hypothetical protein